MTDGYRPPAEAYKRSLLLAYSPLTAAMDENPLLSVSASVAMLRDAIDRAER